MYISEAHPNLLKDDGSGGPATVPRTIEERAILATRCVAEMKLSLPVVLDSIDGVAEKAYEGRPVRVCIVGRDGKLAYDSGRGPRNLDIEEAQKALKRILAVDQPEQPEPAPPDTPRP